MYNSNLKVTPIWCIMRAVLLVSIMCTFLMAQPDDSLDFQNNLPEPQLVWAVQGQDAELPCDVTPPVLGDRVNMVLWFKDNAGIPLYSLDARGGALETGAHWAMGSALGARTFFLTSAGSGRLRVTRVEAEDQGVYRCRVDFFNSRTRNFRVNLTIVVPPDLPMIYDAQGEEVSGEAGPFLEGYDLFLSCHVSGGRPKAAVSWWMGAQLLDATHEGDLTTNVSVNQLFLPSVGRSLWGKRLSCHGRNSNMTAPVVREVVLLVYLKPRKVHIGLSRGELISTGRMHTIKCETWGSVPAPRLTWLLDGEPLRLTDTVVSVIHGINSSTSALTLQPNQQDHGRELTCRAENPRFPGGFVEDRIRLNIAYAPVAVVKLGVNIDPATIKEGDNVYLVCEVTANPLPANISWMHNEQPLVQDPALGILTGERRLLLKAVTRHAAGTYQCVAANTEGETRSESLLLRVQYAPRCRGEGTRQVGALRHETLAVRCEVEADPPSVRFSWTYNRSRDVLHVPGSRVHSAGLGSTLDYTPVSDVDFGTLACWASNAVGRQKQPCLFHVVPARAPRPPEQCMVTNSSTTSSGLEVVCIAGDDGGLPQYFVLEVSEARLDPLNRRRDDDSSEDNEVAVGAAVQADGPAGESPPLLRVLSAEPRFALDSLEPSRRYDLTVHAANARGRSEPVLLPRVRVLASEEHRLASTGNTGGGSEVAQPAALVLGALVAVASLALCCLFAAVAAVLCRHRRSAPRPRVVPPPPAASKPMELSVISAPAPATVRPHRHLRRSAGDEMCQSALLCEETTQMDDAWRRKSGGDPPRSVEPDLIVSKAEVVLHLHNVAMAAKAAVTPSEPTPQQLHQQQQQQLSHT